MSCLPECKQLRTLFRNLITCNCSDTSVDCKIECCNKLADACDPPHETPRMRENSHMRSYDHRKSYESESHMSSYETNTTKGPQRIENQKQNELLQRIPEQQATASYYRGELHTASGPASAPMRSGPPLSVRVAEGLGLHGESEDVCDGTETRRTH